MDEMRLTTSQLLALTGQQPRTLSTWLSRRWLIPYEQGGGKGRQNSFDLFASTWAVMLNEIFRIWPHADTPVTMFVGTTPEGENLWTPCRLPNGTNVPSCKLADGERIITYLRDAYLSKDLHPVCVSLATGYQGHVNQLPSRNRFGWIHLGLAERIRKLIENWASVREPFYFVPPMDVPERAGNAPLLFIRSVSVFNFDHLLSHVEYLGTRSL